MTVNKEIREINASARIRYVRNMIVTKCFYAFSHEHVLRHLGRTRPRWDSKRKVSNKNERVRKMQLWIFQLIQDRLSHYDLILSEVKNWWIRGKSIRIIVKLSLFSTGRYAVLLAFSSFPRLNLCLYRTSEVLPLDKLHKRTLFPKGYAVEADGRFTALHSSKAASRSLFPAFNYKGKIKSGESE